ncbi:MAG: chromosomal replication initiator protein DnaA [Firmicutes bacterium]|nr:chromosomal replication initiator protein DnaA [Bacillota bacterium]MBQ1825146.1 chromosomal replication initiator protein DnaA [Bacillota bacterium]
MNKYDDVWKAALSMIKEQVTEVMYNTWFQDHLDVEEINTELRIIYMGFKTSLDPDLFASVINDRYLPLLQEIFKEILGREYRVVLRMPSNDLDVLDDAASFGAEKPASKKETLKKSPVDTIGKQTLIAEKLLNPKYTFENFVVGPSNSFAYAAAHAVAESPGIASNPLFIYGGSGLGKTHLIQAIGIYILQHAPKTNILYTSSENFTNEFVTAIREQKMREFKSKYRKVDVLIVDDVQFLEGKEGVQEEFFHTFNALFQNDKQIILTADKDPNKLQGVDERLVTRFQWNLMADVQPADFATRVAILYKNAELYNIEVDDDWADVINLISEKIKDNIRELEGAFSRVKFFSERLNEKANKAFAKKVLKDLLSDAETLITPEKIKKIVAKYYGVKVADLESKKRTNDIAFPRQVAMYLIREMTDSSLPKIGSLFGGRDHTTVKYACDKIDYEIRHDENFRDIIEYIKREIKE